LEELAVMALASSPWLEMKTFKPVEKLAIKMIPV
jgi:hypothetical protein